MALFKLLHFKSFILFIELYIVKLGIMDILLGF